LYGASESMMRVVRHRNYRAKTTGFRGVEMSSVDATKPTIDALTSWTFASSVPTRDENDVASTGRPRFWLSFART